MAEIAVKQTDGNEVQFEILATSITKISDSLEQWKRAGLRRHALVVLLVASTRVCKRDVEVVLDGISGLQAQYCLPKPTTTAKK